MSALHKDSASGTEFLLRRGDPTKCLVMLHGIGSNAHSFDRLVDCLPPDWTVLSWNAPGYGLSEPVAGTAPSVRDYADRLRALVRELDIRRLSLVGHSLGTLIAGEFAYLFPELVSELVLISCAQGYGMKPGEPLPDKAAARLHALDEMGSQAFAQQRAPRLLFDPEAQPEVRAEAVAAMAAINPGGYAQAVHMLAAGNLSHRMRAVQAPCLVMVGSQDRITPPQQSRLVVEALEAGGITTSCYREIAGAGHLAHQEKPKLVAAEIRDFVRFRHSAFEEVQR
ncbi:MAG: alpha/beta hydrolase [Pseudomonadota bacterium]